MIDRERGGQTVLSEHGRTVGPPEPIVEVASSSEAIDLNATGVLAYVVLVMRQQTVRGFVLRPGAYQEVQADANGILNQRYSLVYGCIRRRYFSLTCLK